MKNHKKSIVSLIALIMIACAILVLMVLYMGPIKQFAGYSPFNFYIIISIVLFFLISLGLVCALIVRDYMENTRRDQRTSFLMLSEDEAKKYINEKVKSPTLKMELAKDWRINHQNLDSVISGKLNPQTIVNAYPAPIPEDSQNPNDVPQNYGYWVGFLLTEFVPFGLIIALVMRSDSQSYIVRRNYIRGIRDAILIWIIIGIVYVLWAVGILEMIFASVK